MNRALETGRRGARPIAAVLLDWAGTTIDHGSRAPAAVFVEIFHRRGVEITVAEARGPMGRAKLDHIAAVAALPRVADAWRRVHGRPPERADVEAMYHEFLPLQHEVLARETIVIPGIVEAVAACRALGVRIGSTTGYTRALMEVVAPLAAAQGYAPDVIVCADDVPRGRPAPWMNLRAAEAMDAFPLHRVVAVDDTPVGIEAGANAGCITVAVTRTGNALGLSLEEVTALPAGDLDDRLAVVTREFRAAGADHVIASVADLPGLIRGLAAGWPAADATRPRGDG
jgi:phosphonoacetaldehyde hydrolase